MRHIQSCLSPLRVYNKYTREYEWTRCRKCIPCQQARASHWVARLEKERLSHLFSFFVTLTYNNDCLPVLRAPFLDIYNDSSLQDCILEDSSRGVSLPFSELQFSSSADRYYFHQRMKYDGLPYANYNDIKLYHKRLNKYFHDNISYTWQNFRFFCVSEYGSTTFRPHWHLLYFCDSQQVADNFEEAIRSAWFQSCRIDIQPIRSTASSYVAQYLNKLFDLPSFYEHDILRPKFSCSRRPAIGCFTQRDEDDRQIFESAVPFELRPRSSKDTSLSKLPLLSSVENRLFPKCRAYSERPYFDRIKLYGIYESFLERFGEEFSYLRHCVKRLKEFKDDYESVRHFGMLSFYRFLWMEFDGFSYRGLQAFKRAYYVSKRIYNYCKKFCCSLRVYVNRIDEYWSRKELYVLNEFYRLQERISDAESLIHCYPEFYNSLPFSIKKDILPYEETRDGKSFIAESSEMYRKTTSSHFKNAYFDQLLKKGHPLFILLNNYKNYGKKCNEASEKKSTQVQECFRPVTSSFTQLQLW